MSISRKSFAALAAAAVTAATVVLLAAAPAGAAGRDPFTGHWVGVEIPIGDGSTDYMTIGGPNASGVRTWVYWETGASYCSDGGPLSASGTGQVVGGTLTVTVTFTKCANGLPGAFPPPFDISMFATGDGQINWGGVIFNRYGAS
jgi:hypothetical protein